MFTVQLIGILSSLITDDINDDISETISVIEKVIDDNDCDAVIIAGDLNCNFSKNTKHTHKIKNMMFDNNLETAWEKFDIDFTCSINRDGASYFNIIDHFLHSGGTEIVEAGIIHDIDNNSDHESIYCTLPISTN